MGLSKLTALFHRSSVTCKIKTLQCGTGGTLLLSLVTECCAVYFCVNSYLDEKGGIFKKVASW